MTGLWPNSGGRPVREYNKCHAGDGKFCSGGARGAAPPTAPPSRPAASEGRVYVSEEPQVLKGQQVAFESLGKRKFMYDPRTGVLLLGPKWTPPKGPGYAERGGFATHAEMFAELKGPGRYDDYVRGYLVPGGPDGRTDVNIYGFTGGGGYEVGTGPGVKTYYGQEERAIDNQLRTLEYLVKAGAPPDTRINIVAGLGALDTDNLGDLFPESYKSYRSPRKKAA